MIKTFPSTCTYYNSTGCTHPDPKHLTTLVLQRQGYYYSQNHPLNVNLILLYAKILTNIVCLQPLCAWRYR